MLRSIVITIPVVVLAMGGATACATKKFVRTSVAEVVAEVNDKVDSLGRSVEETQERTRRNEARIADVDQRAQTASKAAHDVANNANSAAAKAASNANAAHSKIDALDTVTKRLVFEVVLSEDQGNFRFAQADLPPEAKARLDEMIGDLKADPRGAYFEIEGHTDSIGPKLVNDQLGLERAEAVKRYLYDQHQIPLHKINVISYGEDKPIAPNDTRDGRAQNRRVVIRVLV